MFRKYLSQDEVCILRDHVVQSPDESLFFIPIYDLFRASRCTCVKDRTACRSCLFSRVGGECLDPDSGPQAVWQVPSVSWLSSPQVDFLRTLIFPFLFKTMCCVFSPPAWIPVSSLECQVRWRCLSLLSHLPG